MKLKNNKTKKNKLNKNKTLKIRSYHDEFKPNLTPRQMFLLGSFGGTYWRPIYSSITKKNIKIFIKGIQRVGGKVYVKKIYLHLYMMLIRINMV